MLVSHVQRSIRYCYYYRKKKQYVKSAARSCGPQRSNICDLHGSCIHNLKETRYEVYKYSINSQIFHTCSTERANTWNFFGPVCTISYMHNRARLYAGSVGCFGGVGPLGGLEVPKLRMVGISLLLRKRADRMRAMRDLKGPGE